MSDFSLRHIGINNDQKKEILSYIGVKNVEELIEQTIPENIRLKKDLNLDEAISENEFLNHKNEILKISQRIKEYL